MPNIAKGPGFRIDVLTNGEHCPPHVHVDCPGEGWVARFTFSFADDRIALWDIVPVRKRPTAAVLESVRTIIAANLKRARDAWWGNLPRLGTCLENRWVDLAGGDIVVLDRRRPGPRVKQVVRAVYDPGTGTVRCTFSDGSDRLVRP
ncbi:hypothetical protein [Rhodospirillum centenum]|uniref:DUF4160 domain-containing protein n=1 Tax=Rhodospirillum centenum (strain ATCC 51521 / SW) TaxID=414684 RepID=B6IXC5_RHOCS|nr:hypothetical protein [Rhodospirillum centenum]ACJ00949.1 conserved hypothetical protein [Rhodospirillum centenum SW]